jgi:hypothetical protein
MKTIEQGLLKTIKMKSACVARYSTIRFLSLQDLVLFWHHNLDHINEAKLLSIVEHKLIKGLPKELTVQAIRKYFPHACLACSIGNLQSLSHPLVSIFNPKVPIGAWWSIDFKKMGGTDKERQVMSYAGSTHLFIAIEYATTRLQYASSKAAQYIKILDEFNTRKGYSIQGISLDAEFATKDIVDYLKDATSNKVISSCGHKQSLMNTSHLVKSKELTEQFMKQPQRRQLLNQQVTTTDYGNHLHTIQQINSAPVLHPTIQLQAHTNYMIS